MHYHLEVVLPPVVDVQGAVSQVLAPFDENGKDEDGRRPRYAFWDFWVIGGRWSGAKIQCAIDKMQMDKFNAELTRRNVTVSGLTAGKQELQPASQIPMVDALWREYFPDSPLKACPLFKHFNDQYRHSAGLPDVMPLKDVPKQLAANHVIVAVPEKDGTFRAGYMLGDSSYNGVNFVDARWDGALVSALEMHRDHIKDWNPQYVAKATPQGEWLAVTVDYHS